MDLGASTPEAHDVPTRAARRRAAVAASDAKNWKLAASLWDELRTDFPEEPRSWIKAGEAYRETGKFEEAERILGEAVTFFPNDRWIGYHHVVTAVRQRNWPEALRRAERLRQAFPEFWPGWVEAADALAALGRKAEATEQYREAVQRFPDEFWPNYGFARLAAEDSDAPGAVHIWTELVDRFSDQPAAIKALESATEAAESQQADAAIDDMGREVQPVADGEYRCPTDLAITETRLKRVMVIGSCLTAGWPEVLESAHPGCTADHFLVNNAAVLPERPPSAPEEYDFHFIQIPLRHIMREQMHFRLAYSDRSAFEQLFEMVRERLSQTLAELMRWNQTHGILTFVCNFLVPQQNPMGRLLPRYDLRNSVYFVEKLNEALEQELQQYKNAYLFDFDQIVGTYGRRHFQDDAVWATSHGAALADTEWEEDRKRLEPIEKISCYYPLLTHQMVLHAWTELLAMYRTIRQADIVKLVLVDLDDTLWRGIAAEESEVSSLSREGWPLGFAEALMFLKRRGVLLGIVSKNDERRVGDLWQQIYGDLIRIEDFAVARINWQPKAENIEEILAQVNLLPKSVLFIDDNPVERAAVKAAFPDIRVLGPNPYLWRRILLWAPETQVASVTAESAARTEMVKKQVEREQQRKRLTREEFLASLMVRASLRQVASTSDNRFPRAFELINKTNQFNTTGKRWTQQECDGLFRNGGRFLVLDVADRYTAYGLVGVLIVSGPQIVQFVMSCRVVGMDAEIAAVAGVLRILGGDGHAEYSASFEETPANLLCRDLWARCGFAEAADGRYRRTALPVLDVPPHIELTLETSAAPELSAAE